MGFHLWSWLLEDWNWTAVVAVGFLFTLFAKIGGSW